MGLGNTHLELSKYRLPQPLHVLHSLTTLCVTLMIESMSLFHNGDRRPHIMVLLMHRNRTFTDIGLVDKGGIEWGKAWEKTRQSEIVAMKIAHDRHRQNI